MEFTGTEFTGTEFTGTEFTGTEFIRIEGAREHNLADLTVRIPKRRLTVVTGVSGSGKSSLVMDTIAAESRRQFNETYASFVRNRLPHYGRPDVDRIENLSAAIVVDQRPLGGGARSTVGTVTDSYALLRLLWSRAGRPHIGESTAFSFNDPAGMCPGCAGLGSVRAVDVDQLVDAGRSLNGGAIRFPMFRVGGWMWRRYADTGLFDLDKPLRDYTEREWHALLHGAEGAESRRGQAYEGLLPRFERIWLGKDVASLTGATRAAFERVVRQRPCPDCGGARLNERALAVEVAGRSIAEATALEIGELAEWVAGLRAKACLPPLATPMLAELGDQLRRLTDIGLSYLSLDRPTSTLSGGESQRVKMVRHLASSLVDLLYVFDEPSAGLHPHDVGQLTGLLGELRDQGNTVLVVEHDPDVVAAADHVIDIGPGAGAAGGRVSYAGPPTGSPTGRTNGSAPGRRRSPRPPEHGMIEIRGATRNNLHGVDADLPRRALTVVTGVAGSGKSTLLHGFLPAVCPDTVAVGRGALRGSRRSMPATWTGILDPIRALFAAGSGASASLFSPNSGGGCPDCHGLGVTYTDLGFLDPMVGTCERCAGRRFTDEALRHRYRGRTIGEVLELSARDAVEVFTGDRRIEPVLRRLVDVGLAYLPLGQPLNTLSGGERQRLRLAAELGRPAGVYLFDEPTTGLHGRDVAVLLGLFDRLVDGGATVVVIEHNLDVVAHADWVVDLGPGAGRDGGRVLFQGTPAELVAAGGSTGSLTSAYLRRYGI